MLAYMVHALVLYCTVGSVTATPTPTHTHGLEWWIWKGCEMRHNSNSHASYYVHISPSCNQLYGLYYIWVKKSFCHHKNVISKQ